MIVCWNRRRRCSRRIAFAAAGLLLVSSSCATAPRFARSTPGRGETAAVNAHYSVDSRDAASARRGSTPTSPPPPRIVQLKQDEQRPVPIAESESHAETTSPAEALAALPPVPAAESVSGVEPHQPDAAADSTWVEQASATGSAPSILEVEHASPLVVHSDGSYSDAETAVHAGNFLPADPRVELASETACPRHCPQPYSLACEIPVPVYEPEVYPEEYICDGGDRGPRVSYSHHGREGLDTEDTVGQFTDDEGCVHLRPSTRVCIYAPQFAAVRSMSLHQVNLSVDKLAGTHDHRPSVGFRSRLTPGVEEQIDEPIGFHARSRVSGLDQETTSGAVARVQTTARHIKINNVFENELFLAPGGLDRAQEAHLADLVQSAAAWTRDLNPVIVAADAAGQEVISKFRIEEYVGVEARGKADLKIVKLVDEPTAVPGDVVTFTIHYENVGDRELFNVKVIDNLTPRLELLPDSAQSDREGQFSAEDNGEGSMVLTFELAEPLPGKTAGTFTFQCRVR